jgi:hypothetical protein
MLTYTLAISISVILLSFVLVALNASQEANDIKRKQDEEKEQKNQQRYKDVDEELKKKWNK